MGFGMTTCAQWYALAMVGRKRAPAGTKAQSYPDNHPGRADLNEVVAYNFRAARELRGWTQEETAKALEPLLGQRLPQASISAIERAYEGDRRREFDAQEILAFSLAFDLPLIWFFLPPPADHRTLHRTTNIVSELYEIVFGQERQLGPVYDRLRQLGIDEPSEAARTVEMLTGRPSPARQVSYRERRKQMLLALLDQYGDRVDQLPEEIGAFFDHLRLVGSGALLPNSLRTPTMFGPLSRALRTRRNKPRHKFEGTFRLVQTEVNSTTIMLWSDPCIRRLRSLATRRASSHVGGNRRALRLEPSSSPSPRWPCRWPGGACIGAVPASLAERELCHLQRRTSGLRRLFDVESVDLDRVDPVLMDLSAGRPRPKRPHFGGEFSNVVEVGSGLVFADFLQNDRDTGRKGIVVIHLQRKSCCDHHRGPVPRHHEPSCASSRMPSATSRRNTLPGPPHQAGAGSRSTPSELN